MLLTKHFYKQNSHHYINTTLQTLLTGHYTQGTTLMTPRMDPANSETHPSLHILPLPRTSALRFSVSVVVPLAALRRQPRIPRSTPTHCPAYPPASVLLPRTGTKLALLLGAPREPPFCAPSSLPRTACPRLAPCGGRSGRGTPRPLRLSSVFPPCMGHASHPFCPACRPALSTLQASHVGVSSPRQAWKRCFPPGVAMRHHRAMPISTAFYPPCLAHAEIIIYIMCK